MTNERPIQEEYLDWLINTQVGWDYVGLCVLLHEREFAWFVSNDDNRCQDGIDLRSLFMNEMGLDYDPAELRRWYPATVLEVLVGIAYRLEFQLDGRTAQEWAVVLIHHLELHKLTGWHAEFTLAQREQFEETVENLIWRRYRTDGQGGFFPLAWPKENQKHVEIWYQMAAWINEQHTM